MPVRTALESLRGLYPLFLRQGGGTAASHKRARLVNGRLLARQILDEVRMEVEDMQKQHGIAPGLATVLVGHRPDSMRYIEMKQAVARSAGLVGMNTSLPDSATHDEVLDVIEMYNNRDGCHGILLQLPLPTHLDSRALLGAIHADKDVECFHPLNAGRLSCWRETVIAPCTPRGVMEMLKRLDIPLAGSHVAIVGDSNVVGIPMALMLNAVRATVTLTHLDTKNPMELAREADIVIVACGVPNLVTKDWVKPGATVIDVGINFVRDVTRPTGFRLVGDVCPGVREVAGIVTPVPGGVGPMTVAMLMRNCVDMAYLKLKWAGMEDMIHTGSAADTSSLLEGALVDFAYGGKSSEKHSMSQAEALTIITDKEHNAFNILSFLEMSQLRDRVHASSTKAAPVTFTPKPSTATALKDEKDETVKEGRVALLEKWHAQVHGPPSAADDHQLLQEDNFEVPEGFQWWDGKFHDGKPTADK